jgi:uncharacterized protein YjbI with pentapeptide repeats
VVSPVTGQSLLLEEEVQRLVGEHQGGLIRITGPAGSGKTTALEHLMHLFAGANLDFLDNPSPEELYHHTPAHAGWVVIAIPSASELDKGANNYRLVPWCQDEWIDYLLDVHRDRCTSVMARLRTDPDRPLFAGNAELWRLALDHLAAHDSVACVRQALLDHLWAQLPGPHTRTRVRKIGLDLLLTGSLELEGFAELQKPAAEGLVLWRLLRHRPVQLLLAINQVLSDVQADADCAYFRCRWPRDLAQEVGVAAAGLPHVLDTLRSWFGEGDVFSRRDGCHAMAASVLHAAAAAWTVEPGCLPNLAGAYLDSVAWPGVALAGADLSGADLGRADLQRANLDLVQAAGTDLHHANLCGASLVGLVASNANLMHADLSGSKAWGARFYGANLEGADLQGAALQETSFGGARLTAACFAGADLRRATFADVDELAGADFAGADLEGAILAGLVLREACFTEARFTGARLVGCDLEGMELPGADFKEANLEGALLTGSRMPGACFDGARLADAGLAEIDWEGASLRGADLRRVSFHLGSSRSGLVGSPIACEGSRTGFYTDDYHEQDFKAPEEIRKANLCHADLRGARIDDVDFYLVDLRHAHFDPEQESHLRRCGAILHERV